VNVFKANVMHVCFDIRKVGYRAFDGPVVTLGTFDGVHLGHQAIIRSLMEKSRQRKRKAVVVTYEPHPQSVVSPGDAPGILTALEEKLKLLEELGVEQTVVVNFDKRLRECSPWEFVETILVDRLDVGYLVVGDDHAFGKGRCGKTSLLREAASRYGFDLKIIPALQLDGARVSSTRIRKELQEGRFAGAVKLLGHGYPVWGKVVKGKGRGRELEFPTFNLEIPAGKLLPPDGVYSVRGQIEGKEYAGMMYIGPRLTFGENVRSVEVHLFDMDRGLEIGRLELSIENWVRSPRKFADPAQLKGQLKSDERKIREMFRIDHAN
jgi:riboflavin kinase/FMN adenylyltransferase